LSDTHIGSKKFLAKEFKELINWFKGDTEDANREEIGNKLKYILVAGDIVDGVGIYPNQDKELELTDIYKQYEKAGKIFAEIPEEIQIIISPGNHDFIRAAQPQPALDKEIASELYELDNVTMVSNPATVNLGSNGSGTNVLLYHGVSIDTMVYSDPELKDGYKHPEKVMKSLLVRRHLSPQYETGLLTSGMDYMTIPNNIGVFHAGHVHSNGALNYRGVTIINSGTWQAQTDYQKLCGHEPTPGKLPVLNLKTKDMRLFEFVK
jgi:DNA polymerase II small subunit